MRIAPELLKTYRRKVASPVIIEAREGMFDRVRALVREIVPIGLLETRFHTFLPRIFRLIEFPLSKWKEIKTFNMVATILTPNLIEEVAQWREVQKIYPDYLKWALQVVPPEGLFKDYKEKVFTTTYWTKIMLGLDKANKQGFTGRGVNAVVIDTGSRVTHPQLTRVRSLTAMPEKGGSGEDSNGHGSWCVATVGGAYGIDRRYNAPVEGMAPESSLFSIQALGFIIGTGTSSDIIRAMEMCIGLDAKVVSMSLGSDDAPKDEDNPEAVAINKLVDKGIVPVVAAGNCLPANTWILTPSGYQTIHNLHQKGEGEVVNYNENEKKFETDEIIGVYKRETRGEKVYRIHTDEGHVIEATENHPFLTSGGWKNANELKEGDVLFVKPDTPQKFKIPDSTEFKKGNIPPFKGKRLPEDVRKKISESRKGKGMKENPEKCAEEIARLLINGARITKVELAEKKYVYDISTGRNHTLIANGLILHNSGPEPSTIGSPGSCLNSLTVGSISPFTGEVSDFSSRGPTAGDRITKPDVVAPGERINSALVGFLDGMVDPTQKRYGPISGTSMATPHVAGLITCMAQLYKERVGKDLTVEEIKRMMSELGPNQPKDNDYGWGLITWDIVESWVSATYGITL